MSDNQLDNEMSNMKSDLLADALELVMEVPATIIKIGVAYLALHGVGHLDEHDALATAALLGATDFFARRGRSRFVLDVRKRVLRKLPNGEVIERDEERHEVEK